MNSKEIQSAYRRGCSLLSQRGCRDSVTQAGSLFLDITRRDPTHHRAMNMLGLCLDHQGKRREARGCFRKAIDLAPRGIYCLNLGISLANDERWTESREALEKAASLDPLDPPTFFNLGQVCFVLGEFEDSVTWWRRTLELDPSYRGVHVHLGLALLKTGRITEAEKILRHGLSRFPDRDELYVHLSSIYETVGWYAKGVALWGRYLRRNRHRPPHLLRQAREFQSAMAAKAAEKRSGRLAKKGRAAARARVRGGGKER